MSGYNVFAESYDRLTQNVDYKQRADYICSLLLSYGKNGGILLDAACGTGSFSELFAEKGFDVIGVDSSVEMLMQAQKKKYEHGRDILYLNQNICDMDLYGTVDCAVCCLDSINHLANIEEVEKAFYSIGFFMERDGIFIFDVNTEYKHEEILGNNTYVYDLDDIYCVWQNTYDKALKKTDIHLDIFTQTDGLYEKNTEDFSERFYSDEEIRSALKNASFEVAALYGEMTTHAPAKNEQRVYYVCRKTKDQ